MPESNGILHKISRAFLLQGLLITIAALLGVFFAKIVIEQILIKNAILEEADYFWQHYQQDPNFSLPDSKNLTGYFDPGLLPEDIRNNLPDELGFYEYGAEDNGLVLHLSRQDQRTLYLLYYRGQVDALVVYYGMFPLFTVLLILYLSLWLTYRFSHRTVSPIIRLAKKINQLDLARPDFSSLNSEDLSFNTDNEIQVLADAISHLGERLTAFINRERNFTRDASHELRSPLTVINIAADMLLSEQELSKPAKNSVNRIKRAISDMQQLTEVFLLLARENDDALTKDLVCVNDVLSEEVEQARLISRNQLVEIEFIAHNRLTLSASDKVLSVLFGNLIRNAILYTEQGKVSIQIDGQHVVVEDSGQGMPQQQIEAMFKPFQRGDNQNASGYGIGLTIVKRLSDRFNWPIEVQSELGKGTRFQVLLPDSRVSNLKDFDNQN